MSDPLPERFPALARFAEDNKRRWDAETTRSERVIAGIEAVGDRMQLARAHRHMAIENERRRDIKAALAHAVKALHLYDEVGYSGADCDRDSLISHIARLEYEAGD